MVEKNIIKETIKSLNELDSSISMIPLTYDRMFKSVFSLNKDILKEFLILQLDLRLNIEDIEIAFDNTNLPDTRKDEYHKTVDILVNLDNDIITNIEMNRSRFDDVKRRNLIYFCKVYATSTNSFDNIKDNKQFYQLNLNANNGDKEYGEDEYEIRSKKHKNVLINNMKIYVKNIAFYNYLYYTKHEELDKSKLWLVALSSNSYKEAL